MDEIEAIYLEDLTNEYKTIKDAALDLGISYGVLTNLLNKNVKVEELKRGGFIVVNKHNQFVTRRHPLIHCGNISNE